MSCLGAGCVLTGPADAICGCARPGVTRLGSAPEADDDQAILLEAPDVAPVHAFLENDGTDVYITPGSADLVLFAPAPAPAAPAEAAAGAGAADDRLAVDGGAASVAADAFAGLSLANLVASDDEPGSNADAHDIPAADPASAVANDSAVPAAEPTVADAGPVPVVDSTSAVAEAGPVPAADSTVVATDAGPGPAAAECTAPPATTSGRRFTAAELLEQLKASYQDGERMSLVAVYLNGTPIERRTRLRHRQQISIGQHHLFEFKHPTESALQRQQRATVMEGAPGTLWTGAAMPADQWSPRTPAPAPLAERPAATVTPALLDDRPAQAQTAVQAVEDDDDERGQDAVDPGDGQDADEPDIVIVHARDALDPAAPAAATPVRPRNLVGAAAAASATGSVADSDDSAPTPTRAPSTSTPSTVSSVVGGERAGVRTGGRMGWRACVRAGGRASEAATLTRLRAWLRPPPPPPLSPFAPFAPLQAFPVLATGSSPPNARNNDISTVQINIPGFEQVSDSKSVYYVRPRGGPLSRWERVRVKELTFVLVLLPDVPGVHHRGQGRRHRLDPDAAVQRVYRVQQLGTPRAAPPSPGPTRCLFPPARLPPAHRSKSRSRSRSWTSSRPRSCLATKRWRRPRSAGASWSRTCTRR